MVKCNLKLKFFEIAAYYVAKIGCNFHHLKDNMNEIFIEMKQIKQIKIIYNIKFF